MIPLLLSPKFEERAGKMLPLLQHRLSIPANTRAGLWHSGHGMCFKGTWGKRCLLISISASKAVHHSAGHHWQSVLRKQERHHYMQFCCLTIHEFRRSLMMFCMFICSVSVFSARSFRVLFWTLNPCTSENRSAHFPLFAHPTLVTCFTVG